MTTLIDFDDPEELARWQPINDTVMGGCSSSMLCRQACHEEGGQASGLFFTGTLSLENNGGFASIRRQPAPLALNGAKGIRLRVRGDGQRYQLRLRTDDAFDGIAYRALFTTRADQWLTLELSWREFEPVFRGRRVVDAPSLSPSAIRQIGFMTVDKQAGRFLLQLGAIESI